MKQKSYLQKRAHLANKRTAFAGKRTQLASERTQLANERTSMANERTLLAYFRTSLALFGLAAVVLKFMPEYTLIAVAAVVGGLGLLLYGGRKFSSVRHSMNGHN